LSGPTWRLTAIWRARLAALWLAALFCAIYATDSGRGFIKDDYPWIATSRLAHWADLPRLFTETPMGFYRPMVALSFALTTPLAGFDPRPYAWTNLGLALAIAAGIHGLTRRLGLAPGTSLFAAGVWLFNFHGINLSILWISGRTSLLGTLGAVLAAWAFAAGRSILAATLLLAALFGKEEPLLLPVVLAIWLAIDQRSLARAERAGLAPAIRRVLPLLIAVAVYLGMRAQTAAFTPASAPAFYRLNPASLGDNIVQYADRALTFPLVVVALGALLARWRSIRLTSGERALVLKGLVWVAGGYALTIFLPVRSSLYACLPSVGAAIAAGAIGAAEWRAIRAPRAVAVALLVLPLALWPVYRARNQRLRAEATLAAQTLQLIAAQVQAARPQRIVLYDDRASRPSLADAFGEWLPVAALLVLPQTGGIAIDVHPADDRGARAPDPAVLEVVVRRGQIGVR
jgi:hypothetical protein